LKVNSASCWFLCTDITRCRSTKC